MTKHIANILTGCRIFGSILLLFFPVFSLGFYITYLICGFSDMADGTIARITKSTSELGARLDTVADSVFVAVCFVKILPLMQFPVWLWTWIIIVAIIKIGNIVCELIFNKRMISIHSILNKVAGLLLFFLPLTFSFINPIYSSSVVCFVATLAAIDEGYHTRAGNDL